MNRSNKIISTLIVIYIFFSYFSPILLLSFGENPLTKNIGTLCLFFLFIYILRLKINSPIIAVFIKLLAVVVSIFFISALLNLRFLYSDFVFPQFFNILTVVIVVFIFYSIANNNRVLKIILYALVACALINSLIGLFSLYAGVNLFDSTSGVARYIGFDETTGRAGGARAENYVGFWNVPAIVFFSIKLFRDKIDIKNIVLLIIALSGVAISLSRSSVLTSLIAVILVFIYCRKKIQKRIVFILGFLFLFIFLLSIIIQFQFDNMSQIVLEDQLSRWRIGNSDFHVDRYAPWTFWKDEFLSSSILFGKGPGYESLIILKGYYPILPHNSNLDVLVEFGVLGLIIFLIPILMTVKIIFNSKYYFDTYLMIFATIFLSMYISLFFLSSPFLKNYWLFWGLIWGRYNYLRNVQHLIKRNITTNQPPAI